MKVKYLLVVLIVVLILLVYSGTCYYFVNKSIDNGCRNAIDSYLQKSCNNCEFTYEYVKATNNDDNTINVFVKVDSESLEEYYRFIFINSTYGYQINAVNNDIPAYIK